MQAIKIQSVRALRLFADITDETFQTLAHAAFLQSFPAGVELIEEGATADFLHVVCDGTVELYSEKNGSECTLALVLPVSTFILAALVVDQPYLMAAMTVSASRILMIPAEAVRAGVASDRAFALAVVEELATRYCDIALE